MCKHGFESQNLTTLQRDIFSSPQTVADRLQPRFLAARMTACFGYTCIEIIIYQRYISPLWIP